VSHRIEDYALIGNNHSAALVAVDGSIDWFCVPRFDSPACFAALVGDASNGRWQIRPVAEAPTVRRAYRDGTMTLETTFTSAAGEVKLVDCMLLDSVGRTRIVREVRGVKGRVPMRMEYVVRFDYGSIVPWLRKTDKGLLAVAGPDALQLASDVETEPDGMTHVAEFTVAEGQSLAFELTYFASHEDTPSARVAPGVVEQAEAGWRTWASGCGYEGPARDLVLRSLLTLLALTYAPTGGILAAPTTSLPEEIGSVRNWDYRFCWLRDATFTLYALLAAGFDSAARDWRRWLLRAVAGSPDDLQIVYGVTGARRLTETELPWLAGYENSRPVRIGNGAAGQFQLDVYGEVVDLLFLSHRFGLKQSPDEWALSRSIVEMVARRWIETDRGVWEVRGPAQHFTHSKVMAWVALDRGIRSVEELGVDGPVERWRTVRDAIHADVCAKAFDAERNSFMQAYGSTELDAATLLIPIVGFLPVDDPRVIGTVAAIERELVHDGLVFRYTQGDGGTDDGLPPGEGAFLACSFWLVDNYVLAGRKDEARATFDRLCALANDVGLFPEEYDPRALRALGNFPQAFSHVGLINSAYSLLPGAAAESFRAGPGRPSPSAA
jgi:GH15 family glucan-1,4-alpha-glucosidase